MECDPPGESFLEAQLNSRGDHDASHSAVSLRSHEACLVPRGSFEEGHIDQRQSFLGWQAGRAGGLHQHQTLGLFLALKSEPLVRKNRSGCLHLPAPIPVVMLGFSRVVPGYNDLFGKPAPLIEMLEMVLEYVVVEMGSSESAIGVLEQHV